MSKLLLCSERIVLRQFFKEDVESYYSIAHDPLVQLYVPYAYTETIGEALDLLENYETYDFVNDFYFAICDAKTEKLVGALLAFRTFSRILEVCYFVGQEHRGNEYCLEALHLFVDYLEKHTSYTSLFFDVRQDNVASRKIMQKLGLSVASNQDYFHLPLHPKC